MQHVKWLKLFIYSVNLPWLPLPPVFVHRQDRIATKIACVQPNILPEPIKCYTGMPVVPVTNSMSTPWANLFSLFGCLFVPLESPNMPKWVTDEVFHHNIDYASNLYVVLNHKGHQNSMIGSKVTAIVLPEI